MKAFVSFIIWTRVRPLNCHLIYVPLFLNCVHRERHSLSLPLSLSQAHFIALIETERGEREAPICVDSIIIVIKQFQGETSKNLECSTKFKNGLKNSCIFVVYVNFWWANLHYTSFVILKQFRTVLGDTKILGKFHLEDFPPSPPYKKFYNTEQKMFTKGRNQQTIVSLFQWIILRQKFSQSLRSFFPLFQQDQKNYPISKQLLFSRVTADRLNSFFWFKSKNSDLPFLRNHILFENSCSVSFFQSDISGNLR